MRRLLLVLLCFASPLLHATPLTPPSGPHAVGLRVVHQYDYSRNYRSRVDVISGKAYTGEVARPIQTQIWYPATKGSKPMVYKDYLRLAATEENFDLPPADIATATEKLGRNQGDGLSPEQLKQALAATMLAARDAKPAAGKFPVVIYAPSFNAWGWENADLCELLASHGYVVIASASMGKHGRAMSDNVEGLEAQAADIAFLLGFAHTLPQADTSRVAVAGFSWGGMANAFAAARDTRIKALVSLDGSLRSFPDLLAEARYVTGSSVAVPMLFMASTPKSQEELARRGKDFSKSLLNDMKFSDVYIATMMPMSHMNFSSTVERLGGDDAFGDYTRDEMFSAYNWTARYVLQFLNGYLKDDASAIAFLRNPPVKNGAPRHLISMDARKASARAPTPDNMVLELQKRGYSHTQEVFQAMRKLDPSFKPSGTWLNRLGYQLVGAGRPQDGIEIFKLNAQLNADDPNLMDSLAEGYEALKDNANAIKAYQQVLAIDPDNKKAASQIKALGGSL